jgi:hypothetical protein
MNYGDLIKDAFRITLRNRYLWFFGFFVGLGSGGGGGGGGDFDEQDEQGSAEIASVSAVQQGAFDNAPLVVGLVLLGLLILLAFFALYVVSQGGLTESVAAIDRGEERRFSSTWRAGARNFWRVLLQILLFLGIVLGLLLAVGIPVALLVAGAFATNSIALRAVAVIFAVLVAVVLVVVVFVFVAIVRQFARRELVVRGARVLGSVGSGYRLFRGNLGRSVLVWLVQLGLMLAAGIALVIVGLLLFLPTILLAVAQYTTAAIAAGVVAGLILLPLLVVALAILGTFNHSYWTLAYLRLTSEGGMTRP